METKKLKSIASKFFEVKVKGESLIEEKEKNVTLKFVVNAQSWSECEENAVKNCFCNFTGDCDITDISLAQYGEVVISNEEHDDKWFKVKVYLITEDERSGKEKKQSVFYLTNATTTATAEDNIHKLFSDSVLDYEIGGIIDTPIVDVYIS